MRRKCKFKKNERQKKWRQYELWKNEGDNTKDDNVERQRWYGTLKIKDDNHFQIGKQLFEKI